MTNFSGSSGYSTLIEMCSPELQTIWSEETNVIMERQMWLSVLWFHTRHGVVPEKLGRKAMDDYTRELKTVDLASIKRREEITRHDVKARIEEFNALAGHELIHLGMTSADIVDNMALWKMKQTNHLLFKRWPDHAWFLRDPWFRGIKGAVGTQQDQLDLLGSRVLCQRLDEHVALQMGWPASEVLNSVGQVYPRSIDAGWSSSLLMLTQGKWRTLGTGFHTMISGYSGDQWNEGDVSTSAVRRVALPGIAAVAWLSLTHPEPNT